MSSTYNLFLRKAVRVLSVITKSVKPLLVIEYRMDSVICIIYSLHEFQMNDSDISLNSVLQIDRVGGNVRTVKHVQYSDTTVLLLAATFQVETNTAIFDRSHWSAHEYEMSRGWWIIHSVFLHFSLTVTCYNVPVLRILRFIQSPRHLPPSKTHSHSISPPLAGPHSGPPSTSLWQKWASNVSKSRRSAAAYRELSPIMLRAMRRVDQMLSDITVAAAPPGPLAALAPSPAAWRCRDRASRKCSTASLWIKEAGTFHFS